MAHLWHLNDEEWTCTELGEAALLGDGIIKQAAVTDLDAHPNQAQLYSIGANTATSKWVLLAPVDAQVYVNTLPLQWGMRVLADRDAIHLPGHHSLFFSTERTACIESFPGSPTGGSPTFCPRCKLEITQGNPAVCCPQCGVWHHEQAADGRNCFTYATTCALCDQNTDLESARLNWSPGEL